MFAGALPLDLLTQRLDRFVRDQLTPALYRERRPLALQAWPVPDEPVPSPRRSRRTSRSRPARAGAGPGRPVVPRQGDVPAGWRTPGTRVEVVIDLGFTGGPGFQAEGLAWRPDGTIIKAIEPRNTYLPVDSDGDRLLPGGRGQPDVRAPAAAVPADPAGRQGHRGRRAVVRAAAFEVAVLDRRCGS